jgi:hypothetical protein
LFLAANFIMLAWVLLMHTMGHHEVHVLSNEKSQCDFKSWLFFEEME